MKSTERFSDRVDDYVKYRPSYPPELVRHLEDVGFLFDGATIADIGSGTGIFANVLLNAGYEVWGVEPNGPMRAAAETALAGHPRFHSVDGTAEETTLPGESVDLVTAAQALHWFSPEPATTEFVRITRPPHRLAAIWNDRDFDSTPFLRAYEKLLREFGVGYIGVMHGREELTSRLDLYFGHDDYSEFRARNAQSFDWEGLVGRLLSSSYGPKEDHPNHEPIMKRLREAYDAYNVEGEVDFLYETRVFYGTISR